MKVVCDAKLEEPRMGRDRVGWRHEKRKHDCDGSPSDGECAANRLDKLVWAEWNDLEQKQTLEVFYEKGILKNFALFTGKHLCLNLFSEEHLFSRTSANDCLSN